MSLTVQPTEDGQMTALKAFLDAVVPSDCPVAQAQPNRVPERKSDNFVLLTPRNRGRLSTNVEGAADAAFVASIAGTTMTVTEILIGSVVLGRTLFGVGVADGTRIDSQISGPAGGAGTYALTVSQTLASRKLAAGALTMEQSTEFIVQIDVHGPSSGDIAQTISTVFRSPWAVDQFAAQSPNYGVVPLFADDPRQLPFRNDQDSTESRWMVEAHMQIKPVVTVPQQYADEIVVETVDVDAAYPPA